MRSVNVNKSFRRKKRISSNIFGTKDRPRISVFASNRFTYAQAIDDENRKTITSYSSLIFAGGKDYKKEKKVVEAKKVGVQLAKLAKEKGIARAIFDRGKYSYKGRIKALAEGLREEGLII